jgi:hypothetical protein
MTKLGDDIRLCLEENYTYDTAELRYCKKDLKVFLYDTISKEDQFRGIFPGARKSFDYKILSCSAVTEGKFLPWYQINSDKKHFTSYCLSDVADLAFIENVPEYCVVEPQPLKGVLYQVTLETLQDLDWYYENERMFERHSIQVNKYVHSVTPVLEEAYCYFNPVDTLTEQKEDKTFGLIEGFDLVPYNTVSVSGLEVFEF